MSSRESATRMSVLVRHNTLLMLREPGPLLSRMILPLIFITLLRPLYLAAQGRTAGTEQAVVGTLVTFSLLALSISGSAIVAERLGRTWDRLRGTSLHPAEMLIGKAIPVFAALLAQQLLIVGFGVCVLGLRVPHPFLLLPNNGARGSAARSTRRWSTAARTCSGQSSRGGRPRLTSPPDDKVSVRSLSCCRGGWCRAAGSGATPAPHGLRSRWKRPTRT